MAVEPILWNKVHHGGIVALSRNQKDDIRAFICFVVILRLSALPTVPYSEYQERLHSKIKELHDGGLGYRNIAKWLNENGYETPKGKRFFGNHVYSILKRYKERQERLASQTEKHDLEHGDLWIEYIDYTPSYIKDD